MPRLPTASLVLLLPTACGSEVGLQHLDVDTGVAGPARKCLSFNDGSLSALGHPGRQHEAADGALLVAVEEGGDWSALLGEDELVLGGGGALVLRSSHDGRITSIAQATTEPFRVEQPQATWRQLSEVDDHGIDLSVAVLSPDGQTLAVRPVPVLTGGFVPALQPAHHDIPDAPEINHDAPMDGDLTHQALDLRPWLGRTIRLRFRQHTRIARNGFFTALDDLCMQGPLRGEPMLEWPDVHALHLP